MLFQVRSIGTVRSSRVEVLDDTWDRESCYIELDDDVPSESLVGLDTFSHVEVVCIADRAIDVPPAPWVRHPRGNTNWPAVGIFANRNKDRPNRILLSIARVIEVQPRCVVLSGLDAIDGTPVLDIKPVFAWSGPRGETRFAPWSDELGENYF